jgi:MFS family permease
VIYPAIVLETGWSRSAVTGAFATSMLCYSLGAAVAGLVVDRFGVKVTMIAGCALLSAGTALGAAATDLPQLYLAWILPIGLGTSAIGFVPLLKALVARAPQHIGLGFGIQQLGQGVAVIALTPGLQLLIDAWGWRSAQVALAGVLLLAAIVVAVTAPGRQPAGPQAETRPLAAFEAYVGVPTTVFWLLLLSSASLGYTALLFTHQVVQLADGGFDYQSAASVAGLAGLAGVAGGFLLTPWRWRVRLGTLIAASTALLVVGTIALIQARPTVPITVLAFIVGAGFGRGALAVNLAVMQGRLLRVANIGRGSGIQELALGLGAFAGPWLAAKWRDDFGSFLLGLLSCAVAALIAGTAGSIALAANRRRSR